MYTGEMINVHGNNSIFDEFINELHNKSDGLNFLDRMLYVDLKTWLPDDLLIKADKMTMANSVELRVPFLDHEVIEFAANIPSRYKIKGTNTKFILKETFRGVVPDEILLRKKAGFPIPYEKWLRKEMIKYVRDILLDKKSIERGYFNKNGLEAVLTNNINTGLYSKEIFSLLILEIWHRTFIDKVKL
jgi:asparagine synthase (glutamine-hydrolysing)